MTPTELRESQRRNRQRLYAIFAGLVVTVAVLSYLQGVPL